MCRDSRILLFFNDYLRHFEWHSACNSALISQVKNSLIFVNRNTMRKKIPATCSMSLNFFLILHVYGDLSMGESFRLRCCRQWSHVDFQPRCVGFSIAYKGGYNNRTSKQDCVSKCVCTLWRRQVDLRLEILTEQNRTEQAKRQCCVFFLSEFY